ncbi:hypothetical protein BUALT_Bualt09G0053300 [Buddleja alternifolia]|uniref:Uncharacterized protein n=1 Tax=Buddleja alternifolia TaxID=168488 RepID=A0AAV6XB06_9LAMI|nr:hypothetical protein BUALT_Bualt09G0053300 [Buddleja alternifolia]
MKSLAYYANKIQHLCTNSWRSTRFFVGSCFHDLLLIISCCYRDLLLRINSFLIHIIYFLSLSFIGFAILKSLNPKTDNFKPRNIDLFFTSVSATTVSSMSTVEMEIFSNTQLIVLTILMFIGGEVFTSMLGLHFKRSKIIRTWKSEAKVESVESDSSLPSSPRHRFDDDHDDDIEMINVVTVTETGVVSRFQSQKDIFSSYKPFIKYDSIKFLGFLVLGYLLTIQILGISSVLIYLSVVSSAKDVLKNKGIKTFTFAVFTVVSTFASCGFVPTNENMMVFSKNSGLLLILIPQILLGNTLFPSCLRFFIWVLGKRFKEEESKYLLKNTSEVGYLHLLPGLHSLWLVGTVFGFILIGFVLFCGLEWNSEVLSGLNGYEKVVGVVFQSVNARHTGETIVDLSAIAPAILVFFVVMMLVSLSLSLSLSLSHTHTQTHTHRLRCNSRYLPPYTSFIPIKKDEESPEESEGRKKIRRKRFGENLICSQLSYLVIFIILICITERKNLKQDPLNFNVFNIVVEVIRQILLAIHTFSDIIDI